MDELATLTAEMKRCARVMREQREAMLRELERLARVTGELGEEG